LSFEGSNTASASVPKQRCKRKMELTENGLFYLFAANGKHKRQASVCLLKKETENGSLFFLVGKR
jgi:hypothetical protein